MMQCKISSIQLTLRPPEEALLPLPDEERALLVEPARRLRRQRRHLSLVEPHPPAPHAAPQVAQFRAGRGGGESGVVGPRRAPGAARFQTLQKRESIGIVSIIFKTFWTWSSCFENTKCITCVNMKEGFRTWRLKVQGNLCRRLRKIRS